MLKVSIPRRRITVLASGRGKREPGPDLLTTLR